MELPEHLRLLLSDEPSIDLYAFGGPWRVPDGLFHEIAERAAVVMADERAAGQISCRARC